MQLQNTTSAVALQQLLAKYRAAAAGQTSDNSVVPTTGSSGDSATFSPQALQALEANAASIMLQGDGSKSANSGGDLATLLDSNASGTTDSSDPFGSLFGSTSNANATDPLTSLFGDSGATGTSAQDNMATMLGEFSSSVNAKDAELIKQAAARIAAGSSLTA